MTAVTEDCPPLSGGIKPVRPPRLRGGRLSLTANLSYEPPSPRDARPVHLGPSPSVHRPTRLTRPLAGTGSQASPPGRRASSERGAGARGTFLVTVQKLYICEYLIDQHAAPSTRRITPVPRTNLGLSETYDWMGFENEGKPARELSPRGSVAGAPPQGCPHNKR